MQLTVHDPSLVVLCGPAGSGKSTFAARHFPETAIVSSDRCRAMIADDESDMRVSATAFELFHHIIDARLQYRRLTVADSTALSPDARRDLGRLARAHHVPSLLIVFDVPDDICRRWNALRGRKVAADVIRRQRLALEQALPQVDTEGFGRVVVLRPEDLAAARVEISRARRVRTARG